MPLQPSAPRATSPRAIYEAEADYVWNSLRRLGVPPSDVEDLTQEVFVAAFRSFDRYDPSRPLRHWLFGVAVHVANHFRRQPRHRHEVAVVQDDGRPETHDGRAGPDEAASIAQDRRRLLAALNTLDLGKRAVWVMHEIDEVPIPEVARALGLRLNTAYSRLRSARTELAEALRSTEGAGR